MPSSSQPPKAHRGSSLLFINKGLESGKLSRSGSSNEAFKIHSFVQNRRRRRESLSHRLHLDSSSEDDPHHPPRKPESQSTADQSAAADLQALLQNFDQYRRTHNSLLLTFPTDNPLDPFNAAVVPVNSKTLQFLQYAFSSFSRRTFMAEALPPRSDRASNMTFRHDEFIKRRLQQCIEDRMVMDSTLAVGMTCAGWTTETSEFEKPLDFFLGRAIRAVRTRLASSHPKSPQERQWVLLSIYSLSIATFWLALARIRRAADLRQALSQHESAHYLDAAVLHLQVAKNLITEAGGTANLEPYVVSSLILGDKYLAICRIKPPILSLDWDPGPTPPTNVSIVESIQPSLHNLGRSLLGLLDTAGPFFGHREIIEETIDYLRLSRSIWHNTLPDSGVEHWLFLRAQTLFHRLLSMQDVSLFEDCMRRTVVIFLLSIARYQGMAVSVRLLVPQLRDLIAVLQRSEMVQSDEYQRFLLWAVCIAGIAWVASKNPGEPIYADLQIQAAQIGQAVGITRRSSFEDFSLFLTGYLFLPEEQNSELRRFLELESESGGS